MHVDRQPSPWPCVAMLVGLLLFCLAVPRYWQHETPPGDLPAKAGGRVDAQPRTARIAAELPPFAVGSPTLPLGIVGFPGPGVSISGSFVLDNDLLSLFAPPTIEELIAA